MTVRYLAGTPGVATADLRVNSNALGAPHVVTLRGEAVPPSTISGFTPLSGAPDTSVTISGTSLTGAAAVKFNGLAATFSVNNATSITATVPPGATSGPITVATPLNDATSAAAFQVAPRIAGLLPGSGAVGTVVTITGANFLTTNNTVKFGAGYLRNLDSPDGITLQFTVPDGLDLCAPDAVGVCPGAYPPVTPGSYVFAVVSGTQTSNSVTFTVTP